MDGMQMSACLDRARDEGAEHAELLVVGRRTTKVEWSEGRAKDRGESFAESVSARVWLSDGRFAEQGGATDNVDAIFAKAMARAQASAPQTDAGPVERLEGVSDGLGLEDPRYERLAHGDRIEVVLGGATSVREMSDEVDPVDFAYRDQLETRRIANTKGLQFEETSTTFWVHGRARRRSNGFELEDEVSARQFASVAAIPLGAILARRHQELNEQGVAPTGPRRVLLRGRAVARLFSCLSPCFGPRWRSSFLFPRGTPLALSSSVHLVDDGTVVGGLRSRSFDDHGVCPIPLTLIREGMPDERYVDLAQAKDAGVHASGHVIDGELRPTNLLVKAGTRSANAMFAEMGDEVFVIEDFATAPTIQHRSGALEALAHGALYVDGTPKIVSCGVPVRANVGAVLGQVVGVTSDVDRHGHVDAPAMFVDGFSFEKR